MKGCLEGLSSLGPQTPIARMGGKSWGRVQRGGCMEQCPPLPAGLLAGWWLVLAGVGRLGDSWGEVDLGREV